MLFSSFWIFSKATFMRDVEVFCRMLLTFEALSPVVLWRLFLILKFVGIMFSFRQNVRKVLVEVCFDSFL
jgi:hypothetical protein